MRLKSIRCQLELYGNEQFELLVEMLDVYSLRLSCFPDLCLLKYKKEDFVVYDINLVSMILLSVFVDISKKYLILER